MEPIDWLAGAGMVSVNELATCTEAPLVPYDEDKGSFFCASTLSADSLALCSVV